MMDILEQIKPFQMRFEDISQRMQAAPGQQGQLVAEAQAELNALVELLEETSLLPAGIAPTGTFFYGIAELEKARAQAEREAGRAQMLAEELNSVFAAMTDAVMVFDAHGNLVRSNPAALDMYGFDPKNYPRGDVLTRIVLRRPDGAELEVEELPSMRALKGEVILGERHIQNNARGEEISILTSAAPIYNTRGEIAGSVVAWHDITRMEKVQRENRRQAELLARVVENGPVGIVLLEGRDYRIVMDNPVFQQMLKAHGPLAGKVFGQVLPQYFKPLISVLDGVFQSGERFIKQEFHLPATEDREESYFNIDCMPFFDEQKQVNMIMLILVDVTEAVKTSRKVEEERALLKAIIENAPEAIVVADEQSRVLFTNSLADHLYHRPVPFGEDYPTHAQLQICTPDGKPVDPRQLPLTRSALDGETLKEVELAILWPDGQRRDVLVNSAPILNSAGQRRGAMGIFQDITARKESERALRRSEARSRRLMEASVMAVMICKSSGEILEANDAFLRMSGYTRNELAAGRVNWRKITPPDYLLMDDQAIAEMMERGVSTPYEKEFIHKKGHRVPVLIGFSPLEDDPGEFVVFAVDMSESTRYREMLRQSEERFRVALSHASVTVFSMDRDLRYTWTYNLHPQHARQGVLGKTDRELMGEAGEQLMNTKRKVLETGQPFRGEVILIEDGEKHYYDSRFEPYRSAEGVITGLIGSAVDVSDYRRTADALRETQNLMDLALKNRYISLFTQDRDLRYTWIYNPRAEFDEVGVVGKRDVDLLEPKSAAILTDLKRSVIETGQSVKEEIVIWINGKELSYDVQIEPLLDGAGQIQGLVAVSIDVTERHRLEDAVRQQSGQVEVQRAILLHRELERMEIARDLHDGILQEMVGMSFSLVEVVQTDEKALRMERMSRVQATLNEQIHELRAFCSELRPPALAPFGVEKALRSYLNGFEKKHPELTVVADLMRDGKLLPEMVRLALFRICQELLNNVVKHASAKEVHMRLAVDADSVEVEVSDDGEGFVLPDRWIYLAREGHLGLVGIQERVDAVGGTLRIETEPGQGTRVLVRIPLKNNPSIEGKLNI